uniref:protein-tyrosine-phosphatase n=1 Tax=Phallusia mammillata TaxID=59560 RepID=A0A6F9DBM5_9ASCI|nr:DUSP8.16 dual specificity phosphatase [Phallusia mammillata]
MPVARNLSLPSSIEARKYKKRPEELDELKHSCSVPNNMRTSTNDNNNTSTSDNHTNSNTHNDKNMKFHAALTSQEPMTSLGVPKQSGNPRTPPVSRGTLSQPCLSESANVGVTSIFPHLFLGSQNDASDEVMMKDNAISNVLNVSCNCARPPHLDDQHFRRIAVRDNYQEKITPYLDEAVKFIESARVKNERVLVHCLAGVSRSATVAIAYVMYYLRLGSDDAYRFVKEKRPTISPNFNFLGQLMEFETILRKSGHMSPPRKVAQTDTKPPMSTPANLTFTLKQPAIPKIEVQPPKVTPEATKPTNVAETPISSFCRRRKGPALDKTAFADLPVTQGPHTSDCSGRGVERHLYPNVTSPGGAGVILDLHVSAPPTEPHSRRLGSDGREDDEERSDAIPYTRSYELPAHNKHDSQKSNSLPRCKPGFGLSSKHLYAVLSNNSSPQPGFERRRPRLPDFTRSATAPNTPNGFHNNVTAPVTSRMNSDVEMRHADDDVASPPSPRNRSITDPTSGSYFLGGGFASPNSPRTDSFMSRKTRSPKVLKKSFNLNVRSAYDYRALRGNKQQVMSNLQGAPQSRSRSQDPQLPRSRSDTSVMAMSCASPSADGMSSLTLSSPVANKEDPLAVVGQNCWQRGASTSSNPPRSAGSALAPPTAGQSSHVRICANGTGEPFQLVAGNDLKPRWRKPRGGKKDDAGNTAPLPGRTSAPASSSAQTVLSHCNSVEMISCS